MGGTIHMAIGAAYPETGGVNESAIHWDLLADMNEGEIIADGQTIYRNGKFIILNKKRQTYESAYLFYSLKRRLTPFKSFVYNTL
jgi:hypothetical protein